MCFLWMWGLGQGQLFQLLYSICSAGPWQSEPLSLRSSCKIPDSHWLHVGSLCPLKWSLKSGRCRAAVGPACVVCCLRGQGLWSAELLDRC